MNLPLNTSQKFPLGRVVATPAARNALEGSGQSAAAYLARHANGDWGDLCAEDKRLNDAAVGNGTRLLSSYRLPNGEPIWIITEADRRLTTVLLPSEY